MVIFIGVALNVQIMGGREYFDDVEPYLGIGYAFLSVQICQNVFK